MLTLNSRWGTVEVLSISPDNRFFTVRFPQVDQVRRLTYDNLLPYNGAVRLDRVILANMGEFHPARW